MGKSLGRQSSGPATAAGKTAASLSRSLRIHVPGVCQQTNRKKAKASLISETFPLLPHLTL